MTTATSDREPVLCRVLAMRQRLVKLRGGHGPRSEHADNNTRGIVRECCGVPDRRPGCECQRQGGDDRIAGPRHVEHLASDRWDVRHMPAFFEEAHPPLSPRNQHRMAPQALM